jgi:hypothetical protein
MSGSIGAAPGSRKLPGTKGWTLQTLSCALDTVTRRFKLL